MSAPRVAGGLVYRVDGAGPAALLLHPAYTHSGAFDGEVAALSDRMRLIRVDLPGHGATAQQARPPTFEGVAERLLAVLDAEGVGAVDVLGVSLGSLVGQDFARRHPERARTLTALGGYDVTDPAMRRAQGGAMVGLVARLLFVPGSFPAHVATLSAHTAEGRERFAELAGGFRLPHLLHMRGFDQLVDPTRGDALRCPLLIAIGAFDSALAHGAAIRWRARVPTSELVELPDVGHCANLDDPISFQRAWLRFVEETSG